MTTTATATTDLLDQPEGLIRIPTDKLLPNPDNIRNDDEPSPDLVRSVTERGVLIPPIVLPANPDGSHYLVAGHRRRKAAIVAGRDYIDCLERDLTPIEVLDTMILENEARANLSALESTRAVARYQHLDPKASATKIGKRLGHTATWVKQRWAVAALPDAVVADLGHGISLVQLAALAPVVEHGDDTVTACYTALARNWRFREDPVTAVDQWLARHLGEQALAAKTAELTAAGMTVVTDRPNGAVPLKGEHGSLGMTTEQARAHRHEECHTVRLVLDHASRIVATHYCTRPARHVTRDDTPAASAITVPADQLPAPAPKPGTANPQNQLDKQRRQARDARLEAAGRAIGGKGRLPKNDTLHLAAAILLHSADAVTLKQTGKFLGIDGTARGDILPALAESLESHELDETRLLIALSAAYLETRGTKTAPLPRYNDTITATSRRYLEWLGTVADHEPVEHDLPPGHY